MPDESPIDFAFHAWTAIYAAAALFCFIIAQQLLRSPFGLGFEEALVFGIVVGLLL